MTKIFRSLLCCALWTLIFSLSVFGENGGVIVVRDIVGKGADRQAALVDAFRNAISQALGTYVVTSRTWDGETLDKKIYDNSDAVVKTYKIVNEGERRGKWTVTIDAEIVRNEMMKYIRREVTTKVGEGELANLLAKRLAINNAVQSLNLLFQNWRENVYRAEKYGNITIASDDNVGSNMVRLSVPFIITFRWDAYRVFLSKVRNVLSGIAIDRTQGEHDKKDNSNFLEANYPFYNRVGLVGKDEDGDIRKAGNPNGYGEIRIVSRLSDDKFRYELYIVPNQVKHALDELLTRDAEIRFVFTSKGGESVASQSFTGEVYSFGWEYLCDDDVRLGWSECSGGMQLITIMDGIQTDFQRREWSDRRLYYASVPVPLEDASRISGCTITVCCPSEKDNCLSSRDFTTEMMRAEEWVKVDQKPMPSNRVKKTPLKSCDKPRTESGSKSDDETRSESESVSANDAVEAKPVSLIRISISEKDKELKARMLGLCQLPPDTSSAKKWFALTKDIESFELNQAVFKVVGSALVCDKKTDVYQSKIRKRIKDVSIFEDSFYKQCPDCGGVKTTNKKCSTCAGSGVCNYANCNGGAHLVRGFKGLGGDHLERCRKCLGTGACQDCNGKGPVRVRCFRCLGKGRIFSVASASEIYHQLIEQISNAYQ